MTVARLRSDVDRALDARLTRCGFRKAKDGIFLVEMAPGVEGWVGIGLATRKRGGEVDADPVVGIRHEAVERLVSRRASDYDPTVFRPLYELLPGGGYRTWSFNENNIEERAESLAECLEENGRRMMMALTTADAIEDALRTWAFADVRRTRLPALLLAEGDPEGARAEVDREKALLAETGDEATRHEYESFASTLLSASTG